jgi:hypothetical protein
MARLLLLAFVLLFPLESIAEYYVVYGGCQGRCGRPLRGGKPKEIVVSYVAPAIPCGCQDWGTCGASVPSGCATCGWFTSSWEAYNYDIFYIQPVKYKTTYDPDLSTADDDAFVHPDMDINE